MLSWSLPSLWENQNAPVIQVENSFQYQLYKSRFDKLCSKWNPFEILEEFIEFISTYYLMLQGGIDDRFLSMVCFKNEIFPQSSSFIWKWSSIWNCPTNIFILTLECKLSIFNFSVMSAIIAKPCSQTDLLVHGRINLVLSKILLRQEAIL